MTLKIITSWHTLIQLALALGKAKRSGDPDAIAKAEEEHEAYCQLCLESDGIHLGVQL